MNTLTPTFTSPQTDTGALSLQLAADTLDEAWSWLCRSRENAPDHADIWALRHRWSQTRDALLAQLLSGVYRLTPMLITARGRKKKEALALWSARDALVLKWVALIIAPQLDIPARCEHVKGHGGGPSSVARMTRSLVQHRWGWVCRTDVRGYYGSMNKQILLEGVFCQIKQPVLQDLITQYVHYTVEYGGEFYTPEKGIARGCALSPLMGALYLAQMDTYFSERAGMYYAHYMDDVVILAKTRWQLRRHVRALNEFFNAGEVEQHPDKTFIGRTTRGFDWMGAQMGEHGVEGIAQRAKVNHRERLRRLYERFSRRPAEGRMRMSAYRRRWKIWAMATLCCTVAPHAALGGTTIQGSLDQIFPYASAPITPPSHTRTVTGSIANTGLATTFSNDLNVLNHAARTEYKNLRTTLISPYSISIDDGDAKITNVAVDAELQGDCLLVSHLGNTFKIASSAFKGMSSGPQNNPYAFSGQPPGLPSTSKARPSVDSVNVPGRNGNNDVGATTYGAAHDEVDSMSNKAPSSCRMLRFNETITITGNGGVLKIVPNGLGMFGMNDGSGNNWAFGMPLLTADMKEKHIAIGYMPNCSALNVSSNKVDLGTTTPFPANGSLGTPMPTSNSGAVDVNLICSPPSSNPVPAVATVYGKTTATTMPGDPAKLIFTDPGLYLSLMAPSAWPAQVSGAPGQDAGSPLKFGTSSSPLPLWAWAIPATTSQTNTSVVRLTPKVFMTGKDWNKNYGASTVTITLSAVIQ